MYTRAQRARNRLTGITHVSPQTARSASAGRREVWRPLRLRTHASGPGRASHARRQQGAGGGSDSLCSAALPCAAHAGPIQPDHHGRSNPTEPQSDPQSIPQSSLHGPTLSQWCAAVDATSDAPHPMQVNMFALDLKFVEAPKNAADVGHVLSRVARILQHTPRDRRKASMLDAIATSLHAHPPLLAAAVKSSEVSILLDWALELAAGDAETYRNGRCTAQMATAQGKLGRYCAPFWHRLEQSGVQHLQQQALATVLHRLATLPATAERVPSPTAALLAALSSALVDQIQHMDAQGVANSIYACARLKIVPNSHLASALTTAAAATCARMHAQEVSNTWLGLAKLRVKLKATVECELFRAAVRVSPRMSAQAVSNTLWALASLRLQPTAELQAALLLAASRVSSRMIAQNVSNTLWALGSLQWQPDPQLQAALLSAAQRVSHRMSAQGVANTLWALAKPALQPDDRTRDALCAALERKAPEMNGLEAYMARNALSRLQWPVSGAVQRRLGTE